MRRDTARTRARPSCWVSSSQKSRRASLSNMGASTSSAPRVGVTAFVPAASQGNVDLLHPDGSVQASLCAHPRGYVPDGDAWLMQMIEIRHDEDHFLQTANVHRGSLAGVSEGE